MTFAAHIALLLAGLLPAALLVGGAHSATPRPAQDDPAAYEAKLTAADEELYTRAFRSAAHGRWDRAVRLAGQARDPLPAKILTWMRLSHGKAKLSLAELESFIAANPTWPRQKSLQIRLEKAMREGVPDSRVVALFKTRRPVSGAGRIRLAEALLTEGHRDSGAEWLRYAWVENDFERKEQKRILKAHGALLRAADHARRLDRLLWDGRRSDARALLKRVQTGQRRVAEARIALMRRARDVDRRIERVPPALHADPGLVYERARWRRRAGKTQAARDLLAKYAGDGGSRPEKWWTERNRHVRDLIEKGRMEQAYAIASRNGQPKFSAGLADGEFLAGWLALRFLKQPLRATRHFRKLYQGVRFPISRARAAYWHGRASQALGNTENATRWYGLAARHPATYYGQLATEALGRGRLLRLPRLRNPRGTERRVFAGRELVRAAAMVSQLGQRKLFRTFMLHLGEQLERPMEQFLLARMARRHGRLDLSIRLAKKAARQGALVVETTYPLLELPHTRSERPLVIAVARQESEFDVRAVSPAGARGLMQLMPTTAREVAQGLGLRYSRQRLTADPRYNVRLGDHYLSQLIERYDGSYVLAVAAYNAGPGRVATWMKRNGDPRKPEVDAIDWVELIGIPETRNYVQRVMENLQIYRGRIANRPIASRVGADLVRNRAAN